MAKQKNFDILAKINELSIEEVEILKLEPGTRLGPENRFEIVDLIGNGSISSVYLAKDYKHETLVALKLILPHIFTDEKKLDIFVERIQTLQKFHHPNIIEFFECWQQERLYFYTTEYIEGPTLQEWISSFQEQNKSIPISDIIHIAYQICSGIATLHNICGHYLLHPNNIILTHNLNNDTSWFVKISDCAIYSLKNPSFWQKAAEIMKMDVYRAPELRTNSEQASLFKEMDLYSIGVFLHLMLYQKFPGTRITPRSDAPAQLQILMEQFLDKKLQKRSQLKKILPILESMNQHSLGQTAINQGRKITKLESFQSDNSLIKKDANETSSNIPTTSEKNTTLENSLISENTLISENSSISESTQIEKLSFSSNIPSTILLSNADTEGESTTKIVRYECPAEYKNKLLECKKLLKEKQYRQAIPILEELLKIQDSQITRNLLKNSRIKIEEANKLKTQAQECNNPRKSIKLLQQSLDIYPYDPEVQHFYEFLSNLTEKLDNLEEKSKKVLEEGDQLVEQGNFFQAIELWQTMLGLTDHEEEFRERIMQVVDIIIEQSQNFLDQDDPYQARILMEKVARYSNDDYINVLIQNIEKKIVEFQNRFLAAYKEGEKLFDSKRFLAAISVWEAALPFRPDQKESLEHHIYQAKEMQELMQQQEQEYLELLNKIRLFEKEEKYSEALEAYRQIEQNKETWLCPVSNVIPEIERLTKLEITMGYMDQIQLFLNQAQNYLNKNKWQDAEKILERPLITNSKLPPSLEKKVEMLHNILEKKKNVSKRKILILKIIGSIILIASILAGIWYWLS